MTDTAEAELANRIKTCVADIKKAEQNVLARAFEAGTLLIQAKAKYGQMVFGERGLTPTANCPKGPHSAT